MDDDLALGLAGREGLALLGRLRAKAPRPYLLAFSRWTCVRARFAEDAVERAAAGGVGQYVILGAGLDSFAYRRDDLLDRQQIFEVDHPATQSWKRRRLAGFGVRPPARLVFAPVDFERQTWRERLERAGFDFGQRAALSWMRVTMLLTLDAVWAATRLDHSSAASSAILRSLVVRLSTPRAPELANRRSMPLPRATRRRLQIFGREGGGSGSDTPSYFWGFAVVRA